MDFLGLRLIGTNTVEVAFLMADTTVPIAVFARRLLVTLGSTARAGIVAIRLRSGPCPVSRNLVLHSLLMINKALDSIVKSDGIILPSLLVQDSTVLIPLRTQIIEKRQKDNILQLNVEVSYFRPDCYGIRQAFSLGK